MEEAIWIETEPESEREQNTNIREAIYELERQYGAEAVVEQFERAYTDALDTEDA